MKKIKTIGVVAPAYIPVAEKLNHGIKYLEQKGYHVVRGRSLSSEPFGYFSASEEIRANDINRMFADPEIDIIISARGGWGCLRLVDKLDYTSIPKNPKPLVGYSDITTLQLALWQKCRLPSFSGPMVAVEMGTDILEFTENHFWNLINQEQYQIKLNDPAIISMNNKKNEGVLLGGCLSLMAAQCGTDYMPDFSGSVLFLEDVGEEPYRIDRYLAQIQQAGILENLNGLILGEFIDCETESRDSFTVDEILDQYFGDVNYPVLKNVPYGHGMKKLTMPVGFYTTIDSADKTLIFKNNKTIT